MSTATRRLPRGERRGAILRAAGELLADRAYDAVSMSDVVRAANVSRPVVYDHFPAKRDLVVALVAEHHERLITAVAAYVEEHGPVRDEASMRAILDLTLRHCEDDPAGWRLLCQEPSADPQVAAIQRSGRDEINAAVAEAFELRGDHAERTLAAEAIRAAVNALFAWRQEHPETTRAQLVDAFVTVAWRGIGAGRDESRAAPPS